MTEEWFLDSSGKGVSKELACGGKSRVDIFFLKIWCDFLENR